MTARAGRRPQGPGLTGQDWWGAFDLTWPRGPYRILSEPDRRWRTALEAVPPIHVPFPFASAPPTPWVWDRRGTPAPASTIYGAEGGRTTSAGEAADVYRLGWPAGGLFVPDTRVRAAAPYRPIPQAAQILLEAQAAARADAEGLLAFVNRWGLLGVGLPGAPSFGADGVEHTAEALRVLPGWIAALHALQQGKATIHTWAELIAVFEGHLEGVRLSAQLGKHGLVPRFPVRRLLDALYLELWGVATGGKRLRRCKRCERFFLRTRPDRIFCSGPCARRWHVREWKRRHRRARTPRR